MKNLALFFMIIISTFCFGQVNESFLDGNFINNPIWTGSNTNFIVNANLQLQSQALATSTSYLFTASEAISNATWECWIKINYSTSSSNYACIYLSSDKNELTTGCNGYYIQIGGTTDDVSLFIQEGTKKTKLIDGIDKRTDGNTCEIRIKATRDSEGNFKLYSKLASESDFILEGSTKNNTFNASSYFGVFYSNTATTGAAYYFDDILVTGTKAIDNVNPNWLTLSFLLPNKLKLVFSEPMEFSNASFSIDNKLVSTNLLSISSDKTSIELTNVIDFERGKVYKVQFSGLTDLAGNVLQETSRTIGIIEKAVLGDLFFNEIMFESPVNSLEYIEIYNNSEKYLDVSGLVCTTRKIDGSLNTGCKVPSKTFLLPQAYLALCSNADSVRNFHHGTPESDIVTTSTWSALNNEASTLVLANSNRDTIYDELSYNSKWHSKWVTNPKGISLERLNYNLPTQSKFSWYSSVSSATNYGTPGCKNSEFIDKEIPTMQSFTLQLPNTLKLIFSEPMNFSSAAFTINNDIGTPTSQIVSIDKTTVILIFSSGFEPGTAYNLKWDILTDIAGNFCQDSNITLGIIESKMPDDLVINEIMFDNPLNSLEYIEIYNRSNKILDLSGVTLTTRKTDGSLNTGIKISSNTALLPYSYIAICENADSVRNFYHLTKAPNIISSEWVTLNNESSTIVLTNGIKDTIYDEVSYSSKWHHPLIKNTKGIAIERIHPSAVSNQSSSWHSAASEVNYGTPGFINSQFRELNNPSTSTNKCVWIEPEVFSPDNDGIDDICLIHYQTENNGFVANVLILNAIGEKVFHLADNQLLATNGFFSWDGKTDRGKNVQPGIYVLYFEMFNSITGERKQLKLPLVVSSR